MPPRSRGVVNGDVQGVNGPPSMLHSNVTPGSGEENVKVAVRPRMRPEGPLTIAVSGGVASGESSNAPMSQAASCGRATPR